ncbi:MAG: hypothetical protein ABJ092_00805 [Gillisia sp.]
MMEERKCPVCEKPLKGRSDKKFCDPSCKSAFHYQALQEQGRSFYSRVDRQLKTNRRILKKFNKAGKATVRSEVLIEQGFDPKFFTHYWKNAKGEVYLFVYEFGFLGKMENARKKYVLVTWQPYMEK